VLRTTVSYNSPSPLCRRSQALKNIAITPTDPPFFWYDFTSIGLQWFRRVAPETKKIWEYPTFATLTLKPFVDFEPKEFKGVFLTLYFADAFQISRFPDLSSQLFLEATHYL
jgi:hypothetical protein